MGNSRTLVQITARFVTVLLAIAVASWPAFAAPLKIVALGDSLTAGLGLGEADSFAAKLERALKDRGRDVVVVNAGVSGDTASDGLARLDWSIPVDAGAVIVELGANDALRGIDPEITREALDGILSRLRERGLPVLLAGMRAPPNLGQEYTNAFDAIYGKLAQRHGAILYPFFLDGVAADASLNQDDGMHPNAAGVDMIVERILPSVEALIAKAVAPFEEKAAE